MCCAAENTLLEHGFLCWVRENAFPTSAYSSVYKPWTSYANQASAQPIVEASASLEACPSASRRTEFMLSLVMWVTFKNRMDGLRWSEEWHGNMRGEIPSEVTHWITDKQYSVILIINTCHNTVNVISFSMEATFRLLFGDFETGNVRQTLSLYCYRSIQLKTNIFPHTYYFDGMVVLPLVTDIQLCQYEFWIFIIQALLTDEGAAVFLLQLNKVLCHHEWRLAGGLLYCICDMYWINFKLKSLLKW